MSNSEIFENRVFGAVLVKAITANYNADFTGSPRTLPNGVVYATDKTLKYCIRNYLKQNNETIFYTTRHKKENMQPLDIDETYIELFGEYPKKEEIKKEKDEKKFLEKVSKKLDELRNDGYKDILNINDNYLLKKENEFYIIGQKPDDIKRIPILQNLLTAIDIKLFGATFASKEGNISIHGNVQITHGLNIYEENNIFSEDITSPFRNSSDSSDDSMQTTIGNQTVLEEGHYLHNFTINPKNTKELIELIDNHGNLTNNDIEKFKEAINKGVTYLDSASKAGVENEFSIFITLNQDSKIQLPSFNTLINVEKQNGFQRKLDLSKIKELLNEEILKDKIEKVEIFINEYALDYDDAIFDIHNVCVKSIVSDKELQKCQK
jgi:CRISPR-associated protein Csh2